MKKKRIPTNGNNYLKYLKLTKTDFSGITTNETKGIMAYLETFECINPGISVSVF
jgi:hypothetical protein